MSTLPPLAPPLLAWFAQEGRHDLPWKSPPSPYRIWLSEIMLQQTQVQTVKPYFARFIEAFPTLQDLAEAPLDAVLSLWSGLGYYARARNLHRCAQRILHEHGGAFPEDPAVLVTLPGIGPSTANAIAAQAFNVRAPILDGNVKRVLARYFAVDGWPGSPAVASTLWALADQETPAEAPADYTQAIMDLGALLCRRKPDCARCPVQAGCESFRTSTVTKRPAPRPRKDRPLRRRFFLLAFDGDGALFLKPRPPEGLWGGLLSLPEFEALEDLDAVLLAEGLPPGANDWTQDAPFEHGFTHFRLEITPVHVHLTGPGKAGAFYAAERWPSLPLPAPLKRYLRGLSERSTTDGKNGVLPLFPEDPGRS